MFQQDKDSKERAKMTQEGPDVSLIEKCWNEGIVIGDDEDELSSR